MSNTSGIVGHPLWPSLRKYVMIETYDRDGSARNPRIRIELRAIPPAMLDSVLKATTKCVCCGNQIHPFRTRKKSGQGSRLTEGGTVYYAATCPLTVSIGCSRSSAARDEYLSVKEACCP